MKTQVICRSMHPNFFFIYTTIYYEWVIKYITTTNSRLYCKRCFGDISFQEYVAYRTFDITCAIWKMEDSILFHPTLYHATVRSGLLNIIHVSISTHPILWMNAMLDLICMGFVEQWSTGSKQNIQNINVEWQLKMPHKQLYIITK